MTVDPNGWFLASQALDHRDTVAALISALIESDAGEVLNVQTTANLARDMAAELARAGIGLVRIQPRAGLARDMTDQVDHFLSREKD